MKKIITILLTTIIAVCAGAPQGSAQVFYSDPYEGYDEETFFDMDFEPNLEAPIVPDSERAAVRRFVAATVKSIEGRGPYAIDLMRDGEVMIVTIPTDHIFLPGDTLLAPNAARTFAPLIPLMDNPMRWKLVLAVHTDDTGTKAYQQALAEGRLDSIYELFMDLIAEGKLSEDQFIIPFAMGAEDPLTDNDTWRHRAQNRRVELFFVPGPALIEQAHKETEAQASKKKK